MGSVVSVGRRLHTFASVIGLMLVSLARLAMKTDLSARRLMESLGQIEATLVRTAGRGMGRRPTVHLAPQLDDVQRRAVKVFDLARWLPGLSSARQRRAGKTPSPAAS